jgi:hypothetical protein
LICCEGFVPSFLFFVGTTKTKVRTEIVGIEFNGPLKHRFGLLVTVTEKETPAEAVKNICFLIIKLKCFFKYFYRLSVTFLVLENPTEAITCKTSVVVELDSRAISDFGLLIQLILYILIGGIVSGKQAGFS